jgi:hypothetical protein
MTPPQCRIPIHFGEVKAEKYRRLSCQGNTSLGWLMLRQAVQLGQDIGLFMLPRAAFPHSEVMSPEMERVRAITAWGIFSLNL